MIQPYNKGKRPSIMIWAAFGGLSGQSDLFVLKRDPWSKKNGYTAWSYLNALEDAMPTLHEPGRSFMQDNAPIHTVKMVKQ